MFSTNIGIDLYCLEISNEKEHGVMPWKYVDQLRLNTNELLQLIELSYACF